MNDRIIAASSNRAGVPSTVFIVTASNGTHCTTSIWSGSVSAVISGRLHVGQGCSVTIEAPNGTCYGPDQFASLL